MRLSPSGDTQHRYPHPLWLRTSVCHQGSAAKTPNTHLRKGHLVSQVGPAASGGTHFAFAFRGGLPSVLRLSQRHGSGRPDQCHNQDLIHCHKAPPFGGRFFPQRWPSFQHDGQCWKSGYLVREHVPRNPRTLSALRSSAAQGHHHKPAIANCPLVPVTKLLHL